MKREWTLTAMYQVMIEDMKACTTKNELINCRAICSKEIREAATGIQNRRKLSPGEESVLANL